MPRKVSIPKPAKTVFDWHRLDELIKDAGGQQSVTERAGTSRQALDYARKHEGLPVSEPIRKILRFLNPPPSVIRSLFTKPKAQK